MLKNRVETTKPGDSDLLTRLEAAKAKLAGQQAQIKAHNLPVLVLVEGWGTAGKGKIIGQIIQNIDPRFFKVVSLDIPTKEEKRKPFLYRYFSQIPEAGKFMFLDSGWMDDVTFASLHEHLSDRDYLTKIDSIKRFERQLTDNGYLVMKFFLHISKKEQKNRIKLLLSRKDTQWRVSKKDKWQNSHYRQCLETFGKYLSDTNIPSSPWYIIDSSIRKWAQLQVLETLTQGLDIALSNSKLAVPLLQNPFPLVTMPKMAEVNLTAAIDDDNYKAELKSLQKRLGELHNRLYRKKVPVVIVYEGNDAAGKGGNIKRVTKALDSRGFEVHPIASPEPYEKARHYLWRFWTRLPKTGHIALFDRSWYGRVMVERIEGFCTENDWQRAYNEINEFEKELADWGAIIIKFFVAIDPDTQLERFAMRQNTPEKQWKITDEDWRNREKWEAYEHAIDEMLQKTSTGYAPWHILESTDKKYARIKALKIIVSALEKI